MATTLAAENVFAPFTWVETDGLYGKAKFVLANDELDAFLARIPGDDSEYLSDMEPMPKGWTPETGYDNVDLDAHTALARAFYAQQQDAS